MVRARIYLELVNYPRQSRYIFGQSLLSQYWVVMKIWIHFVCWNPPVGSGTPAFRLGSRIDPHRHRGLTGALGWRFIFLGGSHLHPVILSVATGDVWITSSFRIWGYVLHVEHMSCVITNYGEHQWDIPSLFSIDFRPCWKKTSICIFSVVFQNLLFQATFLIFFAVLFSPYILLSVHCNNVALSQCRKLTKF